MPPQRSRRRPPALLVAALLFFFAPALAFAGGVRARPFENRPLAPAPSVSAGWAYFPAFERWAVDHLPLRDLAVRGNTAASEAIFGQAPDYGEAPVDAGAMAPAARVGPLAPTAAVGPLAAPSGRPRSALPDARTPAGGSASAPAAGPAGAPAAGPAALGGAGGADGDATPARTRPAGVYYPSVLQGREDWLYAGKDIEFACHPELELDAIVAGYRRLAAILSASGRQVILTVAPDKSTIVPEHLPKRYLGQRCSAQRKAELWDRLRGGDLGPEYLDLRGVLERRQTEAGKPIYFRGDSHWTSLGRVVFAREVVERLEPGLYRDSDVRNTGPETRSGDLGRMLGSGSRETADDWEVDRPGVSSTLTSMDQSRIRTARYRATSRAGAPLYAPRTVLMGDSFSAESVGAFRPYFADFTFAHRELWPAKRIPVLQDAQVVILQVVERVFLSDATSSRPSSLLDEDFLAQLQRELRPSRAATSTPPQTG